MMKKKLNNHNMQLMKSMISHMGYHKKIVLNKNKKLKKLNMIIRKKKI